MSNAYSKSSVKDKKKGKNDKISHYSTQEVLSIVSGISSQKTNSKKKSEEQLNIMIGNDTSEDESPQKIKVTSVNPIDLSRKKKVKRPEDEDVRNQ